MRAKKRDICCLSSAIHLTTFHFLGENRASLVAKMVKNLPAMQENWVQSLGQENPLEKDLATHSSILARRIPWSEKAGRHQFMGSQCWTHLSDQLSFFHFPFLKAGKISSLN